ncbi:MAG: tyrosine-type recombinase/integrase [Solirubrobacterales bacterium]|nr:tyrosine-type recombinase/integrase [Solirubrobacterales bacterium]
MAAVCELVSALDGELVRLGYRPSTMKWYRGYWRRLERYFASRGVREFSLDVAMVWVDEVCGGFFEKEQAGTLKQTDVYVFRVAAMLDDFAIHGSVLRRYSRTVSKLSGGQAEILAGFGAWLQKGGCAVSTVRAYGTVAGEFLAFIGARGGLGGLDGAVIGAFVQTLAGYQAKTVEHKLCAVRSLLRFAASEGLTCEAVLATVPPVRSSRQARVPSVWDPGEVTKIVEAIDRGNPSGKRDYAIVLLIARLGLRGIDVRRLRFSDLDWAGNRVSVVQAKTGRRVWLPLLKDVGWAIIDYVRDGRPQSDCPEVFLRHTAPIGPFSDQDHLHQILVKHARVARVALAEDRRRGMHSLRHTLATRLMEDGTPVEQIADILGHRSVESTGVYLKSSLGLLAQCALDPDAPSSGVTR